MSPDVAIVSTYPPTQCGIATFARSLGTSMAQSGARVDIVALGEHSGTPSESVVVHHHRDRADLPVTSHVLNGHDVVILQHEFGIYGGPDGREVLDILHHVTVPVITVLHTVLRTPSSNQRRVLQGILNATEAVVVMSEAAHQKLARNYAVRPGSLSVIPHGAPDLRPRGSGGPASPRKRILTWGLLSEGKGIEWGIEAIGHLKAQGIDVDYVIAGRTHPKVLAREGDVYRRHLEALACSRGVLEHVRFVDDYLDGAALGELIRSADAFLLPYDNNDQVTSGVLVEAMIAGGPVIATRFPHARELLSGDVGIVVPQRDARAMADAIARVVTDELAATRMRRRTLAIGESFLWSSVGAEYVLLAQGLARRRSSNRSAVSMLHAPAPAGSIA